MPLSEHERQALLFTLHVAMVPDEAPEMTMTDALAIIDGAFKDGTAYMRIGEHLSDLDEEEAEKEEEGGENVILISGMDIDGDGIATILFQHGDAAAADPALMQINSGKVRKAGKKPDEGVAHATHLLISTKNM